ncbi:putative histone arginine demethylase, partial [Linnemannia elongata]
HPLGIKPLGNYYMDATRSDFTGSCRGPSLGRLSQLTDEIIMEILNLLSPSDLLTLGATSRVLYGLTHLDEMWKNFTIERFKGDWVWQDDTWRATFLKRSDPKYDTSMILKNRDQMKLKGFYSDVLFQSFYCAAIGMEPYTAVENIDRRSGLSLEDFIQEYEQPGKPVIITDGAKHWPAMTKWSTEYFLKTWPDAVLRAESVDVKVENYFKYAQGTKDESPLYLFDKKFGERCQGILEDMEVPVYFREDFFGMMKERRPDYRWIIIGPARSGSTFHKDPNATSAWNAVITGSKKWIMFPPHILPPGVFTNEDESEVTSPVSLMEWFSNFYASTQFPDDPTDRPLEGICREGEIMFVPRGWWHAVVNLDDCIAITQNYVGSQNLKETMEFLYMKRDQVSG